MPTTLKLWDFSRRSAEILQPTYDTQPSNLGCGKSLNSGFSQGSPVLDRVRNIAYT